MMFKAKSSGRDGISRGGCVGSGGVDGLTAAVLVEVDMVDGWVVGENGDEESLQRDKRDEIEGSSWLLQADAIYGLLEEICSEGFGQLPC